MLVGHSQRKFCPFTALVFTKIKQKSSTRTIKPLPLSQVQGQCFSVKEIKHGNLHTYIHTHHTHTPHTICTHTPYTHIPHTHTPYTHTHHTHTPHTICTHIPCTICTHTHIHTHAHTEQQRLLVNSSPEIPARTTWSIHRMVRKNALLF